ncbi:MAG: hypothetical protein WD795_15415 [Woeseia sp.]
MNEPASRKRLVPNRPPLNGAGLGGDFWYLILKTVISLFVLYALLRHWRPVGAILAAIWTAIVFAGNISSYLSDPDGLVFQGDSALRMA